MHLPVLLVGESEGEAHCFRIQILFFVEEQPVSQSGDPKSPTKNGRSK